MRIIADQNALHWYQSSKQSRRGSCARCAAMMFCESTAMLGETHVTRASIFGSIDREPQAHTFFDQKVDWLIVDDAAPKLTSEDPMLARAKGIGK